MSQSIPLIAGALLSTVTVFLSAFPSLIDCSNKLLSCSPDTGGGAVKAGGSGGGAGIFNSFYYTQTTENNYIHTFPSRISSFSFFFSAKIMTGIENWKERMQGRRDKVPLTACIFILNQRINFLM